MNIQAYLDKMKNTQHVILEFLDGETQNNKEIEALISDLQTKNDASEIKAFLHLISAIAMHHHRTNNFFNSITRIILQIKDIIQAHFTNYEIFTIFKQNQRLLLSLLENGIITFDDNIISFYNEEKYNHISFYFQKEIGQNSELPENFEENRKIGENDNYICELIRNDSVEDFIVYINKNNIPLNSKIKHSNFETNAFLNKNDATLIEYAAFFGSIQIIQYLVNTKAELTSSIWLYAIHSNNPELINFLEDNRVEPEDKSYKKCLEEAIKCHHNNIASYIKTKYYDNKKEENKENEEEEEESIESNDANFIFDKTPVLNRKILKYHNYDFINEDFINKTYFYELCKDDYIQFVDFLLKGDVNVNGKYTIFKLIIFIEFQFNPNEYSFKSKYKL